MNETAPPLICLDQFLKATALVETGGMAKQLIQAGEVLVNGEVETRRRRKLVMEDEITIDGESYKVADAFVDEAEESEEAETNGVAETNEEVEEDDSTDSA